MNRLSLFLLLGVAVVRAQAADPKPNSVPGNDDTTLQFKKLDADADGRISREEFVNARPELKRWWRGSERAAGEATERDMARPEVFVALDVDHDSFISERELANAQITENVRGRINRDGTRGNEQNDTPKHGSEGEPARNSSDRGR